MSSSTTPPRLGPRVPLPPPVREGASEDENEGLRSGDLLEGRYQVEAPIGEGGIGVVYRAVQLKLHRRVAIKLLLKQTMGEEDLRPRFEREAVALAALSHPNIVSLTDYGIVRGRPFLVMELLEGSTLRDVLDHEAPLDLERALAFTRQLVHALAYAHERGIVHRDLKPANMIVQKLPDQPEHLKILDFGLVKFLPGSALDGGVQLSRVGFTFGTPAYMSPEHAAGGSVDGRSDLYSVGILLFEMLTGEKPFDGELDEVLRAHFQAPVPRLADKRPELSARPDLQAFIDHALKKNRDERFATAADMLRALEALASAGGESFAHASSSARMVAAKASSVVSYDDDSVRLPMHPGIHESLRAHAEKGYDRVRRLTAELATRTRKGTQQVIQRTWALLRPLLIRTLDKIAKSALSAKQRLEEGYEDESLPLFVDESHPARAVSRGADVQTLRPPTERPDVDGEPLP